MLGLHEFVGLCPAINRLYMYTPFLYGNIIHANEVAGGPLV